MHSFPPPIPVWQTHWRVIGIHVLLLLLVAGALGGLLLRSQRKATRFDALAWLAAGLVMSWVFALLTMRTPETRPFETGFLIFLWSIVALGSLLSWIRLEQQKDAVGIAVSVTSLTVLGLVISCLLPAVPSAREAASRTQCRNNMHEIGGAFYRFQETAGTLPPQVEGEPTASWRINILPYMDHVSLHAAYDFAIAWDAPKNLSLARQPVTQYTCPTVPLAFATRDELRFTSYALATGDDGLWPAAGPLKTDLVTDGTSHTLMLLEACGQQIVWTEPRDMTIDETAVGINLPGEAAGRSAGILSSYHTGGAHVTLADGAVRFLNQNIDPVVLEALLTANGGEESPEF